MSAEKNYHSILKNLKKLGVQVNITQEGNDLIIGQIRFSKAHSIEKFSNTQREEGLLLSNSSRTLRQSLQKKGINYIDTNGNLFLIHKEVQFLIENIKKTPAIRLPQVATRLSPTNLISPNGLAIIDTLFRLDDHELESFSSTLQFCKRYNLYQPKASQIMKKLGVKNLIDFKKHLKKISLEWWLFALDSPISKRKMTAFFGVSQNYYSLDNSINSKTTDELTSFLNQQFEDSVTTGPLEIVKSIGEIIDDDFSIWVSPVILSNLKKQFKLVPGTKEGRRKWLLASPPTSLIQEGLITHEPKSKTNQKTNYLRVIWDLGFGDFRLQEVRTNMLRKLLNEV